MTAEADNVVQGLFDSEKWQSNLVRNQYNRLVECWQNVALLLNHLPEWKGILAFDAFSQVPVKLKETPTGAPAGEWTPEDEYRIGMWLSQKHQLTLKSLATINTGVMACCNQHKFHPVVDWLKTLVWDERPRLEFWLSDCLGVVRTEYSMLVAKFFIMNMVRRVMDPGCIMRYVPVLEGAQNKGKSTALRILGGQWYSDAHLDLSSKDAFELIQGVWLQEIPEMGSFNKSEANRVKHFISTVEDWWVPKYIRGRIRVKRQVAFAGSTNEKQYLKDWTGNTRMLPLRCLESGEIELDVLAGMREQLFAEAMVLLARGERAYATPEQETALFVPQQEARLVDHPWREPIVTFLETPGPTGRIDMVSTNQLLAQACHVDTAKLTMVMQQDVGRVMDSIGWERRREPNGARRWFYHRPVEKSSETEEKGDPIPF